MTCRQRSHRIDTATFTLLLALGLNPLGVGGAQTAVSSVQSSPRSGERHIALEGAPNFRDLGGYATADGRHVRWNRIYRSGELSRLTDADYERLAQLRIAVVCDFRRDSERSAAPTTWRGAT